ncbi:MAG: sulfurtransferase-like selenium metabolism protein YedF [Bacillota bacterium]|nr:sulfurtransferase-like selenium metabolism protein YedF [Bacillota bacterium]
MHKIIDNRGLSCPKPVINTKKALDELFQGGHQEFTLTAIVDNVAAGENVARFARTAGCRVTAEEKDDGIFIIIEKPMQTDNYKEISQPLEKESCCCAGDQSAGRTVFLITSSTLGQGSEELGKLLMRSFIYSLTETSFLPSKLLFLNSGVFLTTEGSPILDELNQLIEAGVEVFSCGTCLDYYELKDKLKVGKVTNMYDTVENIRSAAKCITL